MSIVKKGLWGTVSIVATVLVTKLVETKLELTFFSSAMSWLGNWLQSVGSWLDQPVPVQMWELMVLVFCVLAALGLMTWIFFDANGKLAVLGEEVDAANATIAYLQAPKEAPPTDEQDRVIAVIAAYDNAGKKCKTQGLPDAAGLTLLQAVAAIDVLEKRKLVSVGFSTAVGKFATLTAAGRAYVLRPDFKHAESLLK